MNEFVSPQSVPRLVGTFDQPEGLLTGAVRREPFCVLLLDEIEKAHPDVFDLLLQILGEARLTDALGRTANFSSTVIIMTSNLGTRQAAREVGFAPAGESSGHVYRKAVEEFFRPEFLNRIDRIVPFDRLDRADLEQISQGILADVAGRAGLSRRRCADRAGRRRPGVARRARLPSHARRQGHAAGGGTRPRAAHGPAVGGDHPRYAHGPYRPPLG